MRRRLIIGCLIILCLATGTYFWRQRQQPTKPVKTVAVTKATIVEQATAIGDIVPQHSVTVKSRLSGTVAEIYKSAGDHVQFGTPLLRIKPNPTPQQYAAALEKVQEDQVALNDAKRKYQNFQYLLKNQVILPNYSNYLDAKQRYQQAKTKLSYDKKSLALTKQGSAVIGGVKLQSIVDSPIEGYILQRNVDLGNPVVGMGENQTATILYKIANMEQLMFKGSVDERDANRLKLGMPATIRIGAIKDVTIKGKLASLALQSDNLNATTSTNSTTTTPFNVGFAVKIKKLQLPKDLKLRSGYTATATIVIKTANDVPSLPESAIVFKQDKTYVKLPDAKQTLQPVTLGLSDGMRVQIVKGVKLGQRVVTP